MPLGEVCEFGSSVVFQGAESRSEGLEDSQSFWKCYKSTILCIAVNLFPQQYCMQDQVFANTSEEQLNVLEIRGYVNFQ